MFLVTTALAAVGVVGVAGTAQASMQPPLCSGYSACIQAGYTDHGYGASNGTSYWHEFTGDNCTNYAAYMEVQNNFSTQSQYWPGDANNWGSYFSSYSNSTPAVGSIAWWGGTQGDHVAYVENVIYNSNGTVNSIVVSEDNWGGVFDWRVYLASDSANWPSGFLHFRDFVAPTGSNLIIRQGSVVSGKTGLGDAWTTLLPSGAVDIQAAGTRIAVLDSNSTLWVKDGIGGTWINEAGSVTQYSLTTSTLVIRQGSSISAKANLSDPWTLLWSSGATDVRASGTRIAFLDASGVLRVKDGIGGTWVNEYTGVSQYVISSSLLLIRTGGGVMGKVNLSDPWTTLWSSGAVDIQAAGTRIAVLDSNSTLWVKDGIGSAWINEQSGVSQYAMTQTLLVVRQAASASAKVNLTDAWTVVMPSGVANVQAGSSRIALLDTSGNLWAKDQIDSAWYNEANSVTQFALSG